MTHWAGIVTDKDTPIFTAPHYHHSMPHFNKEQTTFGAEREGLHYNYSDRLWQWDSAKMEEGTTLANESGSAKGSALWHEIRLSHFEGRPITLHHVIAGVNRGNGYPYAVFGYTFDDDASAAGQG